MQSWQTVAIGYMELNDFGLCMGTFLEHKKVVAAH